LVEVLIAVTLLAIAVVALATASLYASRTITRSRVALRAAEFQQSELERLLAVPYSALQNGTRTTSVGTSSWTVADSGRYRRILLVTNYAPAQGVSVWDTVVAYRLQP
jgi:Tfp pilus assembly protein PilV